jgi:predicted anti-sigma-YlaC factor YlaD
MMMSCQEVSRLLSESMERKLSFWERVGLWLHLGMCKLCRGFSEDLRRLRDAARQHAEAIENDMSGSDAILSQETRERMKRILGSQNS